MNEPVSQHARTDSPATGVITWIAFISYSHKDTDMAERVQAALEHEEVKVWRDQKEILPGDNFVAKIGAGLTGSGALIFLISPDAHSAWMVHEYSTAVALSNEPMNPLVIIPVLIKGATDRDVPVHLISRHRVDLRDESRFNDGIKELIRGIKRESTTIPPPPPARTELPFLKQISFLGFFPEGLLPPAFDCLVSHLGIEDAVADARQEGIVLDTEIEDIDLITAAAGMIRTLFDHISNQQALARETLVMIEQWIGDTHLFDSPRKRLGVGRSLLVRDLLILAGYLSDDDGRDAAARDYVIALARRLLPQVIEENLRIAAEISKSLMETVGFTGADYLMHARLLLGLGLTEQALLIFDSYGSDVLFADADLDAETRIFVIQDWAKAVKDSGLASEMHQQLVLAYEQLLVDVEAMTIDGDDPQRTKELEADILNDQATQLAVYGDDSDWEEAQDNIQAAAATYQSLGLNGKLLASRANLVSHSLDRFKRTGEPPARASLQKLLDSLDSLDKVAKLTAPNGDLFFFYYQKARLLKRLYPNEQERAIRCYELAADVAGPRPSPSQSPRLPSRFPIAWRWVLKLSHRTLLISEDEYLSGLRESGDLLKRNSQDAWAANTLYATLLELTMILQARGAKTKAWDAARETFEVAAELFRRSGSPSARRRLAEILRLMSHLNPAEDLRASFLQDPLTNQMLRPLVEAPAFRGLKWEDIFKWLKEQEE